MPKEKESDWQLETAKRIVAETFGDLSAPIDPGDVLGVVVEAMQEQEIRCAEKLAKALADVAH